MLTWLQSPEYAASYAALVVGKLVGRLAPRRNVGRL